MSFQTRVVEWVNARIQNGSRFISVVSPLGEKEIAEFQVPEWALKKGIAVRTDTALFASPNLRLKKTPNKTWTDQDGFPFRVHFAYKDK